MTRPSRYLPTGKPVILDWYKLTPGFYVRFYGPMTPYNRHAPWGWYQASKLVANYKEALAAFHEWVEETKNEQRHQASG